MSQRMENKIVVITGAGSGMGRASAELFAENGATVAVLDRSEENARETVEIIQRNGGQAEAFVVDVSQKTSVDTVRDEILGKFGAVHSLINIAGIFDSNAVLLDTDEDLWDRIIDVDLKGVYLMCRAFMTDLQKHDKATIVNMASIAGIVAHAGGLSYTAAKHGVIGITKSISQDYGPNVRCNAVLPGLVRTPLTEYIWEDGVGADAMNAAFQGTPAGRYADTRELAEAVYYLASDASSFVYGHSLVVDGGWTTH